MLHVRVLQDFFLNLCLDFVTNTLEGLLDRIPDDDEFGVVLRARKELESQVIARRVGGCLASRPRRGHGFASYCCSATYEQALRCAAEECGTRGQCEHGLVGLRVAVLEDLH